METQNKHAKAGGDDITITCCITLEHCWPVKSLKTRGPTWPPPKLMTTLALIWECVYVCVLNIAVERSCRKHTLTHLFLFIEAYKMWTQSSVWCQTPRPPFPPHLHCIDLVRPAPYPTLPYPTLRYPTQSSHLWFDLPHLSFSTHRSTCTLLF